MDSLVTLANQALFAAKALESANMSQSDKTTDHSSSNGVGKLSDSTMNLAEERAKLQDTTHMMQNLTREPADLIYEHLYRFTDIASWIFLCQYDIPAQIPINGSITYSAIGAKNNIREPVVRRYIENLMVSGFFAEDPDRPGHVCHTANSLALIKDPKLLNTIGMLHDEMLPSIIHSVHALRKWPLSQETNESGFSLANDTNDTMYQVLAKDPKKAQRFGLAMSSFTKESFSGTNPLALHPVWSRLDATRDADVIDLGGSLGHLSFTIAKETSILKFVIQDLPPTARLGEQQCPEDMRPRVSFEAYDFLTIQKPRAKPVNAILIANTLQNWPDKYVISILRNQIPILTNGSKILIYERPLPERADPRWSKRMARTADMLMGSLLNGMLRTSEQWRSLLSEADERFSFAGIEIIGEKALVEVCFVGKDLTNV